MHRILRHLIPPLKNLRLLGLSHSVGNELKSFPFVRKTSLVASATNLVRKKNIQWILALSVLQWLGFEEDDEEKENELIMTLKRAVLCTQREQYDKAEQMLHLALRLAQQQQNHQGIIYCYDLMANLAMDTQQLEKAQKLFVSIMQMLLADGVKEDDLKMIHISLKIARINHLLANEKVAEMGYKWCLDKIDGNKDRDYASKLLYGVVEDWYAQFLLDSGEVNKAKTHLEQAYRVCCDVQGANVEQRMLLLNDLGITSWRAGDLLNAKDYLTEALNVGKELEDQQHLGVINANLGLIYLQSGLPKKAQEFCKLGWKLGKQHNNVESIEQSNYCLDQIKEFLAQRPASQQAQEHHQQKL